MYIIIVGCGRVGSQLALKLSAAGHDVVIIDKNPDSFRRLGAEFDGLTITGSGFSERTLREAGIKRADALTSVTELDNTNLMIAEVANRIFGVPKVIARLYNPDREITYRRLGVEYITGTALLAGKFYERLAEPEVVVQYTIDGETEIIEFKVAPDQPERRADELTSPGEFHLVSVTHAGSTLVAEASTPVEAGDAVVAVAKRHVLPKFSYLWRKT